MLTAQQTLRRLQSYHDDERPPPYQPIPPHPPPPYHQPPPPLEDYQDRAQHCRRRLHRLNELALELDSNNQHDAGVFVYAESLDCERDTLRREMQQLLGDIQNLLNTGNERGGVRWLPTNDIVELGKLESDTWETLEDIARSARVAAAKQAKRDRSCLDGCVVS